MSGPSGQGSGFSLHCEHSIPSLISVYPATQTERRAGVFSIAVLGADTMLAALPATPVQLSHACRLAGYDLAVPASWGDELIAAESLHQLAERGARPAVMCACPHVRKALLAVGPDLAPMLVPLVSPPVAVARYLHALYGRERVHLTYIGGCPAGSDDAIDAQRAPSEFLEALTTQGICLAEQPRVFDSVIPPDRRRFFSVAGGVPSAEQLWSAGNGRSLVELDGEDYLIDLAQHLLSHQCTLIDLAPRLGCACSGVSSDVPARSARAAVAVIEPPRAASAVVDATAGIDLTDPVPFGVAPVSEVHETERADAGIAIPQRKNESAANGSEPPPHSAAHTGSIPAPGAMRRRSPAAGIRSIQGIIPVARVAGRRLPRAYIASRRPAASTTAPHDITPTVPRVPPLVTPEPAGDENGRSRPPARVAAPSRPAGQSGPAAAVAAGAAGAPERMGDGPPRS
jgi:hypothetical protein